MNYTNFRFSFSVIATTRPNSDDAAAFKSRGHPVIKVDLSSRSEVEAAYEGIHTVVFMPTPASVRDRLLQLINAVEVAVEKKVPRFISLAALSRPDVANPNLLGPFYTFAEQYVRVSPLNWVVIRMALFTDVVTRAYSTSVASGKLALPLKGRLSLLAREDLAAVTAAVILNTDINRKVLDIGGEKAYTLSELAEIYSKVSGKTVEPVLISLDEYKASLTGFVPPTFVDTTASFYIAADQGFFDVVTEGFEELTGRKQMTVEEFIRKHNA